MLVDIPFKRVAPQNDALSKIIEGLRDTAAHDPPSVVGFSLVECDADVAGSGFKAVTSPRHASGLEINPSAEIPGARRSVLEACLLAVESILPDHLYRNTPFHAASLETATK